MRRDAGLDYRVWRGRCGSSGAYLRRVVRELADGSRSLMAGRNSNGACFVVVCNHISGSAERNRQGATAQHSTASSVMYSHYSKHNTLIILLSATVRAYPVFCGIRSSSGSSLSCCSHEIKIKLQQLLQQGKRGMTLFLIRGFSRICRPSIIHPLHSSVLFSMLRQYTVVAVQLLCATAFSRPYGI